MRKKDFVLLTARTRRCQEEGTLVEIDSIKYIGEYDVYNMEVRHHHNYSVCGGFIIHNCQDATRYAVMGLWQYIRQLLPQLARE